MKTILFSTDFTESATTALNWAKLFARQYDATLVLLHVQQIPVADATLPTTGDLGIAMSAPGLDANMAVDLESIDRGRLAELAAQLHTEGITCRPDLRWGAVADTILTVADEHRADLIVLGRSHLGTFLERLMGTEATGIARKAHCPVLIVPADSAHPAQVKTVLFSTSLAVDQAAQFGALLELARMFSATLSVVHVQTENQPELTETAPGRTSLQRVYGDQPLPLQTITAPTVTDGLVHYLQINHPDVLVMTNQDRDFLTRLVNPSMADRMVILTDIPLLIYHTPDDL